MSILHEILRVKHREVTEAMQRSPIETLKEFPQYAQPCRSLRQAIFDSPKPAVIAEFKRRSPSRGVINSISGVAETVKGYAGAGASGISVLTDGSFFGGSLSDLCDARAVVPLPLLRKDFVIHPYQLHEAKAAGADVVLLIAAALTVQQVEELTGVAHELGLEVLLEVHGEKEVMDYTHLPVDLIGVNNRDLKTFEVRLEVSEQLALRLPPSTVWVSESGFQSPEDVLRICKAGYRGFLLGEQFMRQADPGKACRTLLHAL